MDDAKVDAVTVVVERSHVMEVLCCAGKIRKRNEAQQRLRRGADLARGNHIASKRLPSLRIEYLHRQAVIRSRGKLCCGEVSAALSRRRNSRKDIVGIRDASQRESAKEESLGAAVVDLRNVQWSADKCSNAALVVFGFCGWLPGQRVRLGIEDRIPGLVIDHSMRLVDVEIPKAAAASTTEDHDRTTTSAATTH